MSGGAWGYRDSELRADAARDAIIGVAVARTEAIVDRVVSSDTSTERGGLELVKLWAATFDAALGDREDLRAAVGSFAADAIDYAAARRENLDAAEDRP